MEETIKPCDKVTDGYHVYEVFYDDKDNCLYGKNDYTQGVDITDMKKVKKKE